MKIVAVLMVLVGAILAHGAVMEFFYYGPESRAFWVGVFTTPAGTFFAVAGLLLWFLGQRVRGLVLLSALLMAGATIAATVLHVMGVPATLMGMIGSLAAIGWFWLTRAKTSERVMG